MPDSSRSLLLSVSRVRNGGPYRLATHALPAWGLVLESRAWTSLAVYLLTWTPWGVPSTPGICCCKDDCPDGRTYTRTHTHAQTPARRLLQKPRPRSLKAKVTHIGSRGIHLTWRGKGPGYFTAFDHEHEPCFVVSNFDASFPAWSTCIRLGISPQCGSFGRLFSLVQLWGYLLLSGRGILLRPPIWLSTIHGKMRLFVSPIGVSLGGISR